MLQSEIAHEPLKSTLMQLNHTSGEEEPIGEKSSWIAHLFNGNRTGWSQIQCVISHVTCDYKVYGCRLICL